MSGGGVARGLSLSPIPREIIVNFSDLVINPWENTFFHFLHPVTEKCHLYLTYNNNQNSC